MQTATANYLNTTKPVTPKYCCKVRPKGSSNRKLHRWTQRERDIIRNQYRGTRLSKVDLAEKIGVTEAAVAGQISRMGICKTTDRRPWTQEEDQTLIALVHKMTVTQVAKRMGRSVNSVTVRSKRLKCSRRIRDDWYTLSETADILGKDTKWVKRRITSGSLRARQHHRAQAEIKGGNCWHINRRDLKQFLQTYPHELTGRNVNLVAVVDILAGLKPLHKE